MLPKQGPLRVDTAFSQDTVTPVVPHEQHFNFSIEDIMRHSPRPLDSPGAGVRQWDSDQVIDWMIDSDLDHTLIECFERHDITGAVLMDLKFEDLKELGIESFGKRHQLWNMLCVLQGRDGDLAPQHTPFLDTSRPCTTDPDHSPIRNRDVCETPIDQSMTPTGPGKKRRGRKAPKALDVVTPAESVSIVAIEQLVPKPHKCAKGERCAKWRKQQRELKQLQDDHGIGQFPVSPRKGGHIFVAGNPGNALTADNMIPNVQKRPDDFYRPQSDAIPSVVASSDLLGPGQLPEFALHADMLDQLDKRDPQDNVKAFLSFQHLQSPGPPADDSIVDPVVTPVSKQFPTDKDRSRSPTLDMFPPEHIPSFTARPTLRPLRRSSGPYQQLSSLPRLDIPRSASAQPEFNLCRTPQTAVDIPRCATASPRGILRLATPASEVDVPVTAFPVGPVSRDTSQSVPPDMQFREPQQQPARSLSRARAWRRPSVALEALKENEIFSLPSAHPRPALLSQDSSSSVCTGKSNLSADSSSAANRSLDPSRHQMQVQHFGYGEDCTHAGWMRKRRTKMLRHEWQNSHFRLNGTQLAMHPSAHPKTAAKETIDVDHYSVACSTASSSSKLGAAFKSLSIRHADTATSPEKKAKGGANTDPAPFAFQLIPESRDKEKLSGGKIHHFAVQNQNERIDWMRELMLAKALQQKREGYEVEVNGVQA